MSLVTVKPKFQITIPAKLRRGLDLREGDIMEATVVADGILFRPKAVVDRWAAAERVASNFADARALEEDLDRLEEEIMEDVLAEIEETRRERRQRKT